MAAAGPYRRAGLGPLRWAALLLLAVLLRGQDCSGSSVHRLGYFLTAVSEPGPGLPRFVAMGFVDGQLFARYDSHSREMEGRAPWMEKATQEDPRYWESQTRVLQGVEAVFRVNLDTLRGHYNQSAGLHTLQRMLGCELSGDQPSGGRYQFGYEGRDFIALDRETLTWTAAEPPAGITKRRWEAEPAIAQGWKNYLEETCIHWLRKYLDYGKEVLLRKEPPVLKVTRKDSQDGLETLHCQAHGFYPKEIDITWRKDGVVRHEDTFSGVVSPNADGTYYTWLSIEIDPKERSRYRCHVEHDGLQDPLDLNVEESGYLWLIGVGVATVVLLGLLGAGLFICLKKHQEKRGSRPTSTNDQGSDSSTRSSTTTGV